MGNKEQAVSPAELKYRQSLSLEEKEEFTAGVIEQWYQYWDGKVYISFSGGKDSTVLLDQVRKLFPEVPAVFVDTGLEYPEIRSFVKTIENVTWIRPKMKFQDVIEKWGYPVVSKIVSRFVSDLQNPTTKNQAVRTLHLTGYTRNGAYLQSYMLSKKWNFLVDAPFKISNHCCDVLKKRPIYKYQKSVGLAPFIGVMASNSLTRRRQYYSTGCNTFNAAHPSSKPLSIWFDSDIWDYIRKYNLPYSKIYDMGEHNTGCMFCAFGVHLEKGENRFQRMARTHPKHYKYCMEKLGMAEVLDYIGIDYKPIHGFFPQEEINKWGKIIKGENK